MGRTNCKKHGMQSFYEVCEHIDEEYRQEIYQEHFEFDLAEMYGILVCGKCWKNYNLDNFQATCKMANDEFFALGNKAKNKIEGEWTKVYNSVNRQLWCVECIAEIQVKQARKEGKSEPFPIFERTLNSNSQDKINELESFLTLNFQFKESLFYKTIRQPNRPALSILGGGLTYPLTITTYYVKLESEQNRIIQLVKSFLQEIKFNQAKFQFFEAENLIITENQFGFKSCERGIENLLREVYLNC